MRIFILLVLSLGGVGARAKTRVWDFRNPARPCATLFAGLDRGFGGALNDFVHLDIHDEPWARQILRHFWMAETNRGTTYVAGELVVVRTPGEPLVVYYGPDRVAFFDQPYFDRTDDGDVTTLKVRGTETAFEFRFEGGVRRSVELWVRGLTNRAPVHVLTAASGLEFYAL